MRPTALNAVKPRHDDRREPTSEGTEKTFLALRRSVWVLSPRIGRLGAKTPRRNRKIHGPSHEFLGVLAPWRPIPQNQGPAQNAAEPPVSSPLCSLRPLYYYSPKSPCHPKIFFRSSEPQNTQRKQAILCVSLGGLCGLCGLFSAFCLGGSGSAGLGLMAFLPFRSVSLFALRRRSRSVPAASPACVEHVEHPPPTSHTADAPWERRRPAGTWQSCLPP